MFVKMIAALLGILIGHSYFGFEGALWGLALHGVCTLPPIFYFNVKLDIQSWWRELVVLPALPLSYFAGLALTKLI